ncbi:Na/Pi symporter [Desulfosporosinus sp. PR]|uniref:Na/Pi cotransporter family protein n=1 Tax=Candidatus Desulfosporosinus nitrosoreducens TaxID=3401928 RepID=UPI0027FC382E|nr:Na/Pi symporter [Desulfosporosinus sp. PR]MDQ7096194.1 Na/Pi symporter [Desulfosporosinus sp. PR]
MYLLSLILGLSLLLWGMKELRQGLQSFAGLHLRRLLLWMTATPIRGFGAGGIATAFLQSSNALIVMAVSFVDAELLPFENTLALILGSNIGSTLTTQLLAFPLARITPYLLILGALGYLFISKRIRYLFLAVFGLSLLFFALSMLQAGMAPLADKPAIQAFLQQLGDNHLKGVLAGTLLSALLQSSSATTGIVMLLAENGRITLSTALAFIFGANIGTCFTAVLAALASSRAAQRVALFHVLLNVFGVLLFLPFIGFLAQGIAFMGGGLSRQVANAHSLFNILSSLLAFPFLARITRLLKRILP